MTGKQDPLSRLLLDGTEVDRGLIAGALAGRIGIDKSANRFVLLPDYVVLSGRQKIIVVLLAAKAANLLDAREAEPISVQEATEVSGLPRGTVAPTLRRLKAEHIADQASDKAYYVPNAALQNAVNEIKKEEMSNE